MRITHVVRQFQPAFGGLENVVLELASEQVRSGHTVRVVTLDRVFSASKQPRLPARENIRNIDVVRIPYVGSTRYPIAPAVLKHLRNAEIVHVHAIDFFFDFLAWTKLVHRKKLVASTHGGFFHTGYMATLKQLYFTTVTRQSAKFYGAIVAVSPSDEKIFHRIRRAGMLCIENGVNIEKYANASSNYPQKTIIYHGRFSSNKRLDRVIALLASLRRLDGEWKLKIAGRPSDETVEHLGAICDREEVSDAVKIVSSPSDEELRTLMGGCSVAVSASEYEGFGLSAVEGMSAGLLPILSPIPPYEALVSRTGMGVIVDFSDPKAAAQQLLNAWHDFCDDYDKNRAAVMRASVDYGWQHAAAAYQNVYSDVIGENRRTILGVSVRVATPEQATQYLDLISSSDKPTMVAFANAHALNVATKDESFRSALAASVVFNDGVGVDVASRLLFGSAFPANVNGTDFVPRYLQTTSHRFRIYLLGSKPHVVKRAAAVLSERYPQHLIVGQRDGYFDESLSGGIATEIRHSAADIVLVAMGNPKQEIWLARHLQTTGCKLGFAVGALFDFMAMEVQRAPLWIQKCRLEWLYRLCQEPKRLWARYVIGNPEFLMRVLLQWWSGARV